MTTENVNAIESKKRVLYYDVLNICATLGVVFLHCNGIAHNYSPSLAWYQALMVEVILYWPVPIFFMLSGATLMNYRSRYTTKEFFRKRFMRTVIPFIVWTLISAAVKQINPLEISIREFINRCFNTSIENVYWFFIPLFAIYLAMPGLSMLKEHRDTLWYLAASAFVFTSLLPYLFNCFDLTWNSRLTVPMVGGHLIFVIMGYLFSTHDFNRRQRIIIYILGIFGVLLRYGMTVFLSTRDGAINKTFFGYTGYFSVFLAAAVFVLFKQSKLIKSFENNEKLTAVISGISSCSFGVYLIHMFILRYIRAFLPSSLRGGAFRLLGPFVIYLIAIAIVFIIKKIPILKRIVP